MSAPLFRFTDIRKTINGKLLFDIGELILSGGQCILLRGDNGAGKTTLVKLLAGLLSPDTMRVEYLGKELSASETAAVLKKHSVYLHQQPYMFDCSVSDNIAYGLRRRGLESGTVRQCVNAGLEWGGLSHLAGRNGKQLSGGERQRVALVRAHVLQPSVMLLDEPTAGMDAESRRQSLALVREMRDAGTSVVLISHEATPDMQFAEMTVLLSEGRLSQMKHNERERFDHD